MLYGFIRLGFVALSYILLAGLASFPACGQTGTFTLQVGLPSAAPTPLVTHADVWRFHEGTNAPLPSWQTSLDAQLDPTLWGSGAGGFGYADNTPELVDCQTVLSNMINNYTTIYLRKSFTVTSAPDSNFHLQLRMDFDDGFIAWLDGNYLTNMYVTNAPAEPTNTATASTSHESSHGNNGQAPTTFDFGAVGNRLAPGTHILSLIGVNQAKSSSDLVQVADLLLVPAAGVTSGKFFSLVKSSSVQLSGSNSLSGAVRVVINGDDAAFNQAQHTWSKTQALNPGVNRYFIAALDRSGNILASTNYDIVAELSSSTVSGTLAGSTNWSPAMGIIHVPGVVTVPATATLSIAPGTVILMASAASIEASGSLQATGTVAAPIYFFPEDGTTEWGELSVSGTSGHMVLQQVESLAGRVRIGSGATGLLQDSYFHDNYSGSSILSSSGAASVTVRRIHVQDYLDINFNSTPLLAEDSLFENVYLPSSDAFEMSDAPEGLIVRHITCRRILGSNSDSMDFNGAHNVLVDSCLLHDVADKGVSVGAACAGCGSSYGVVISNCVIYNADIGSAVKDGSTASYYQNTILNCGTGLRLYPKYATDGGHITNGWNNILWGNTSTLWLSNNSTVALSFCDLQNTNWPGAGNINADPLFGAPALHDYTLATNSPCLGTGSNGLNMGATSPVGGLPGRPINLAVVGSSNNPVTLTWIDDADNETGFLVQRSLNTTDWEDLAHPSPNATNYTDASALADTKYYYRVRAENSSGTSPFSNISSGIHPSQRMGSHQSGNQAILSFLALPGCSYTLQYRDSLAPDVSWTKLMDVPAGQGGAITVTNSLASPASRFFQFVSPQQ